MSNAPATAPVSPSRARKRKVRGRAEKSAARRAAIIAAALDEFSARGFAATRIDDVARLTALVDSWRRRPGVDPRRIYVLGFSNGGFMAHRLACRIGDRLAAVASIGGAGLDAAERCTIAAPVGVLEVHGDGDRIVRPDGGRVFNIADLAPFPSTDATLADLRKHLRAAAH